MKLAPAADGVSWMRFLRPMLAPGLVRLRY